ncbi:MAG: pyruvate kinase [candidate division KSB1 bacterium]|nr:pyruvate kinase [candidate division KSB1 bacterium]
MNRAKIVCTIGPATQSEAMIEELIQAGMNVARLNFSHGTQAEHARVLKIIRETSEKLDQPVAILQDLQGPKIRTGKLKNGTIQLIRGHRLVITTEEIEGTEEKISTTYQGFARDVTPGNRILLDDGLIQLKVLQSNGTLVTCEVVEGGTLSDYKGINLPGVAISEPSVTEKDKADLLFGIEQGVDYVALSFVRSPKDVLEVREIIHQKGADIPVIAKLEKPEAIDNLEAIMEAADGVMVARGDLGVELPPEKVPAIQKRIINLGVKLGKPVITATQMLESMREHSRPTRAEVSDVANAIFDGTDAVMLSAETATGKYPVESVRMMSRIIQEAEAGVISATRQIIKGASSIPDAISEAACQAAEDLEARAIVAFTQSGFTAQLVSKYRPRIPIIAFTPHQTVQRRLSLLWGVSPLIMELSQNTDELIKKVEQILLSKQMVQQGEVIVILLGAPIFVRGTTNLMKIHRVGK